jgi:hypothetical protein
MSAANGTTPEKRIADTLFQAVSPKLHSLIADVQEVRDQIAAAPKVLKVEHHNNLIDTTPIAKELREAMEGMQALSPDMQPVANAVQAIGAAFVDALEKLSVLMSEHNAAMLAVMKKEKKDRIALCENEDGTTTKITIKG